MFKKCSECQKTKPVTDFHWKSKKDGWRRSMCKPCCAIHRQTPEYKALHKERNRRYRLTTKGRARTREGNTRYRKTEKFKKAVQKYRDKFPERRSAQVKLQNAVAGGKVVRPDSCLVCATKCIPEGHHHDYDKPFDVIWVCKKCHTDFHWSKV